MNDTDQKNAAIHSAFVPLRIVFGIVPIVAGLDKFTNVLVDWKLYIAPWAANMLPVSPGTFMHAVGVVEIVVGLLVLSRFVKIGAYAASAWLALVGIQLLTAGFRDVAVRDLVLAVAAFSLARLTEAVPHEAHEPGLPSPRDLHASHG